MPKKIHALIPTEREKECDHAMGFPYTGTIPCTGPRTCPLCGSRMQLASTQGGRS